MEEKMKSFWTRLIVNAAAIAVTAWLLPGITIGGNKWVTILLVALIFGIVNAVIKPIFSFLTCGLYIVTLGLFTFIANALMLLATSSVAEWVGLQFKVDGFWTALVGALIISIVSFVLSLFVGDRKRSQKSD
jgi:putative membrane protein